ncbi:hypothetical protein DYI95_001580 [Thermaerobacter sp. PB12/4term]|uniref:hypothetical protein n=1 Tax=Thermaerobacter sp. PB12/4term TaxID=2293838 RepID=UPI0011C07F24|nr:hypothetical protein [Thermaerobacter sp. PB12/4term]QIA26396.1 hypothetical protein DYI95_001580 [Thermaerobacter sp. PB12/4term]
MFSFESGSDYYVRCDSNFTYSSSDINAIQSYYRNNSHYPGADCTDMTSAWLDHCSSLTTLPDAHFDQDDDDGNALWEEAEVTSESPLSIKAGLEYTWRAQFCDFSLFGNMTGEMQHTFHESYWSSFWREYQTQYWTGYGTTDGVNTYYTHGGHTADLIANHTFASSNRRQNEAFARDPVPVWRADESARVKAVAIKDNELSKEIELNVAGPRNADELKGYVRENEELINSLGGAPGSHRVMITFNKPMSLTEFSDFVLSNNISPVSVELRSTNSDGLRGTIYVKGALNLVKAVHDIAPDHVVHGVIAVDAVLRADKDRILDLSHDSNVALIDVHPSIAYLEFIRQRGIAEGQHVDINVKSIAWWLGL